MRVASSWWTLCVRRCVTIAAADHCTADEYLCNSSQMVGGEGWTHSDVSELTHELGHNTERHDDAADEEVGDGEAGEEAVGDVLQALLRRHRHAHQHVTHNSRDHNQKQRQHLPVVLR